MNEQYGKCPACLRWLPVVGVFPEQETHPDGSLTYLCPYCAHPIREEAGAMCFSGKAHQEEGEGIAPTPPGWTRTDLISQPPDEPGSL